MEGPSLDQQLTLGTCIYMNVITVNWEILARILFSQITLKDIHLYLQR